MIRTIYTFYCYSCHRWQKSSTPTPCTTSKDKLISVFCPTCQKQIALKHTNLSPERYKTTYERQWKIIDQDAQIPYVVFLCEQKETTEEICRQLNSGIPVMIFQNDISTINDIWNWIVRNNSF